MASFEWIVEQAQLDWQKVPCAPEPIQVHKIEAQQCYRIRATPSLDTSHGDESEPEFREAVSEIAHAVQVSLGIEQWSMLAVVDIEDLGEWLMAIRGQVSDSTIRIYSSEVESFIVKYKGALPSIPNLIECLALELGRFCIQGYRRLAVGSDCLVFNEVEEADHMQFGRAPILLQRQPIVFGCPDVSIQLWGEHHIDEIICSTFFEELVSPLARALDNWSEGR